jgi:CubicO group peptidase (beta-lactamase class C family)
MNDTFFTLDDAGVARSAVGYSGMRVVNGAPIRNAVPILRDPGGMVSAAGARSTALDVARWLNFLRNPSAHPEVLSPASVALMKSNVVFDDTNDTMFGYGLVGQSLVPGTHAFGHTGSGMGFSTVMRMTNDGIGVVALTNDFSKQMNRAVDMIMAELVDVKRPPSPPGAPPRDPAWSAYLGDYLTNQNKVLTARTNATGDIVFDGAILEPVPGRADTFIIRGGNRQNDPNETLFFMRDANGKVTYAVYGGTTLDSSQRYIQRL